MKIEIRRANPNDAEILTQLAHAAKRYWRYPESWIDYWKSDLTITPEFISENETYVAMIGREIVGCCALMLSESVAELEHMWISPEHIGNGVGRVLFNYAVARARNLKVSAIELSADPNAEGFYERMGAKRIGKVSSEIHGQPRLLPRMKIDLQPTSNL